MSKLIMMMSFFLLVSCTQMRGPASIEGNPVAYDSMALGNVKASAVKRESNEQVCFDINLITKDVKPEHVHGSNWTLAWVDSKNHYHLLPLTQRDPASTPKGGRVISPYGSYTEYSNAFTTCAPKANIDQVKSLVLTPKELPYAKKDGMKLTWTE